MVSSFNSRTPGGVRLLLEKIRPISVVVSIHAPREGCDEGLRLKAYKPQGVSIHAPREGCDNLGFVVVIL